MIYISSVALRDPELQTIINISRDFDINFELSANITYEDKDKVDEKLRDFQNKFLIHNYFPRPHEDFVINLASSDVKIRKKSVEFACNNIKRCEKFGIPIYTIHSGFRFDPGSKHLGTTFKKVNLFDYNLSFDLFIESLKEILLTTGNSDVSLLIENNVLTFNNLKSFGENPLLCCDYTDYVKIFKIISDHRLGILADFGHLKVSANTLNFSLELFYEILKDKIYAHHLSDNDNLFDTNEPFENPEIFKKIKNIEYSDYLVLEINNVTTEKILEQKELLQNFLKSKK